MVFFFFILVGFLPFLLLVLVDSEDTSVPIYKCTLSVK